MQRPQSGHVKQKAEDKIAESAEKAKACVRFAVHKLEDVLNFKVALLSGATPLSEASNLMDSVVENLKTVQHLVNENTASNLEFENDSSQVQKWMTSIKDVSSRTVRVILQFLEEAGKSKPSPPDAVKKISTKPVNLFLLNWLGSKMSKIQSELEEIIQKAVMFHNKNKHNGSTVGAIPQPARESNVLTIEEMGLVGYEALQEIIIEKLIDSSTPQRLEIAIIGPAAAGKSTLAKNIYQRIARKNNFNICFWLFDMSHIDDQRPKLFKEIDILQKMFVKLELGNSYDRYDKEELKLMIKNSLKVKKYLVVIDNVWMLKIFREVLPDEKNGSRVLVATNTAGTYDLDPHVVTYKLQSLSLTEKERLKLILRNSFEKKDSLKDLYDHRVLAAARKISECWDNSPMMLLLLGGHLLFSGQSSHIDQFKRIVAADKFDKILSIVYNKLPSNERTCFAYMAALFPVNYLVNSNTLIQLWIAEEIIPMEHGNKPEQNQQKAWDCLQNLIKRGFVRVIRAYYHKQGNQPSLVVGIHPMLQTSLVHNCTTIKNWPPVIFGKDVRDISGYYGESGDDYQTFQQSYRLALQNSYEFDRLSSFQEGNPLPGFKYPNLHSLFFFGSVAPLKLPEFGFLRVLALFQSRIRFCQEDSPCWLDHLINLRYLGFIVCWVESGSLGKKLSRLTNLQTLDLSDSFVSGLSEFKKHTEIIVMGPIEEELQGCWSPIPDI